ncbi:MAG: HupE/UreJ family protein, partial [Cyanobacteria bacterium P01_F01_bin.53]
MLHRSIRPKVLRLALATFTCLLCLFSAGLSPQALAHAKAQSYLYFQIGESAVTAHVAAPIQDLNKVLDLGLPTDRKLARADVEPVFERIRTYAEQHTDVQCAPQTCELTFTGESSLENTHGGQFLQIYYEVDGFETRPDELQVAYDVILADKPEFTNFLLVDDNWKTGTFDEEANIISAYKKAGEIKTLDLNAGSFLQGFLSIMRLGIEHIVGGVDHVLFLIALLLPSVVQRKAGAWRPVEKFSSAFGHMIKIATVFTVAHSVALGLTTLQMVDLPSRFVES